MRRTEEEYRGGLDYLKTCYGADAYSNEDLIAFFSSAEVASVDGDPGVGRPSSARFLMKGLA